MTEPDPKAVKTMLSIHKTLSMPDANRPASIDSCELFEPTPGNIWIRVKFSNGYAVSITTDDLLDLVGQKWAEKLINMALENPASYESTP